MSHHKNISIGVAAATIAAFFFLNTSKICAQQQEICNQSKMSAISNGYHYELWTNGKGSVCMTVYGQDARFKAVWSNVGDFVARVGLKYDETKTAAQLGTFTADLAFTKSNLTNLTYMGIYGWSVDPLIEYYILEDWNSWRPTGNNDGHTRKGTITVDGAEYEVLTKTQTDQPSIKGTATFTQFWSIRKSTRQSGKISVSEHFKEWEKLGMKLGKLYEVKVKVEGMNGAGTVDFTKAIVTLVKPTGVINAQGEKGDRKSFITNGTVSGPFSIVSLDGSVIKTYSAGNSGTQIVPINNTVPGMYFLQGNNNTSVNKSVIVK